MHLPDINMIMMEGNFEELKFLYDKYEINAYYGDNECNLPFFKYTPCSEFYKWLVEQGLDVSIRTSEGETPLHCQAWQYYNNIKGLILVCTNTKNKTLGGIKNEYY